MPDAPLAAGQSDPAPHDDFLITSATATLLVPGGGNPLGSQEVNVAIRLKAVDGSNIGNVTPLGDVNGDGFADLGMTASLLTDQLGATNVALLGGTTALLLLCVFTVVNIALLILRKQPVDHEHFRTPTVLPYIGAATCFFLAGPWARTDVRGLRA